MKGLFLNNCFQTLSSLKLIWVITLGGGVALVATGSPTLAEIFVHITILLTSTAALSGMSKEQISKWNIYELILPIKRKDIIKSKYCCYLFWVCIGLILSFVFVMLTLAIHGNIFYATLQGTASLFSLGAGLGVMTGAIFYPLAYIFGIDKSELILSISVIISVALAVFLIPLIKVFGWFFPFDLIAFVAFYIFMYAVSYFLTLKLYKAKEF